MGMKEREKSRRRRCSPCSVHFISTKLSDDGGREGQVQIIAGVSVSSDKLIYLFFKLFTEIESVM